MKPKPVKPANRALEVKVEDDRLVISIGISVLAFAAQNQPDGWESGRIVDEEQFAKDVRYELERETDGGSTPVHFLLDKACRDAAEQGSAAIE